MQVKRVLNNNAVLAIDDDGNDLVVIGRGLGHGRRPGDEISREVADQVFVAAENANVERLARFLDDIPLDCLNAAGEVAALAGERLDLRVSQALVVPLADHLSFAVERLQAGIRAQFPLAWEVSQLYPKELSTGREALGLVEASLGVRLHDDEAVALAMHFVNAQFATPGMEKAMQMTGVIAQAFALVDKTFGFTVDQQSMNAARFVTHLRYLFSRVASGKQISEKSSVLVDAIIQSHAEAVVCAAKIQYLLEMGLDTSLTRDEVAYLALHVARLVADVNEYR
ncbi:beta-glucoside operon antiterminator [Arthrobacter sp. Hiyo8]|uniref:PRD domain-containing protein n=1 Tax=Arthrobacter sp. Hiyo1 TaxID=1588020 RepID=UPI000683A333|nr:PRD domain-containing protein [Arthrobacter sp. Hiyo1]BAS12687.1 beta-glucoside operon antiterminator [Arthrobacter sp. Hiyo8]GAP59830.1 beta-glucoside operon antiterminator [Arthrobacter sp. Hiyo1]